MRFIQIVVLYLSLNYFTYLALVDLVWTASLLYSASISAVAENRPLRFLSYLVLSLFLYMFTWFTSVSVLLLAAKKCCLWSIAGVEWSVLIPFQDKLHRTNSIAFPISYL